MNKTDLISHVAEKTSLTKKDASSAIDAIFDGITQTLKNGKDAAFVGFGSFKVSERKAREGRNPRTAEIIKIPASKALTFKCGKQLKDAVNS